MYEGGSAAAEISKLDWMQKPIRLFVDIRGATKKELMDIVS
jgi:hypothetical protein